MVILRSGVIFVEPIILRNPAIKTEEGDKETDYERAEDAGKPISDILDSLLQKGYKEREQDLLNQVKAR